MIETRVVDTEGTMPAIFDEMTLADGGVRPGYEVDVEIAGRFERNGATPHAASASINAC